MVAPTRGQTKGNRHVDYTALRQDLNRVNPVVSSTLSHAVPRNGRSPEPDEISGHKTINQFKLQKLSDIISNNINAAVDLRIITPYIDKAELIWGTILLYPNGKQEKILTHDTQPSPRKSSKLHAELLPLWENYYLNDYKIEQELKPIISDLLFNTGSYTLFNLSRPGLDYLINGSEIEGVQGNEAFRQDAKRYFDEEFVSAGGKITVRNKGRFVRDPSIAVTQIGGLESILGGNQEKYSGMEFNLFESALDPKGEIGITFTDNPAVLYLQKFNEMNRRSDVSIVTGQENMSLMIQSAMKTRATGKESDDEFFTNAQGNKERKKKPDDTKATTQNLTERQLEDLANRVFPTRNVASQTIQFIKPSDALKVAPYGRGLTWHVPSEAVIPVHLNGSNGTQVDYIFLTDPADGSFLKSAADFEFYQGKSTAKPENRPKAGSTNNLIANLRQIQEGKECDFDMSEFAEMMRTNIVKRYMAACVSGKSGNISIELDEETNKIFLQRIFRAQGIRCLYVPGEAVTYMTLNRNRLGIGQSLTQLAKMHIARLAAFDLADAMANLEAATPHTQMTINIDEKNPDPFGEIAIARAAFFEANPRLHSILSTAQLSVPMIVDALRENSLTMKVNAGDNQHFPASDIQLDQLDKAVFKPVDDASRQELLNKIANYFHLSKSWLDVSDDQNNFQIEALAEHEMLLNQVVNWQEQLGAFLADFERKHAVVNAPLMTKLIQKIVECKANWAPDSKEKFDDGGDEQTVKAILTDFLTNITVSFPAPTSTETTAKLKDSLDTVKELVDKWMDMAGHNGNLLQIAKLLNIDVGDTGSDSDDQGVLAGIKAQVKSVFLADAFRRYNLPMPFDDIINEGKGGGLASMVNAIVAQRQNVGEFLALMTIGVNEADAKIFKTHMKKIQSAQEKLQKAKDSVDVPEGDVSALGNPGDEFPASPDDGSNPGDDDLDAGGENPGDDNLGDDDLDNPDDLDNSDNTPTPDDAGDAGDNADGKDPTQNDPTANPFDEKDKK